jgi:uncharacterized membrane protein
MTIGDIVTVFAILIVGIAMTIIGFAELRCYFWPTWRVGYRRDKPSFFSGLAWSALGLAIVALAAVKFCFDLTGRTTP